LPDEYLQAIQRLRDQGDEAQAEQALREFRRAYPDADARLPQALVGWARTVR
jgi:hypothetical protein